MNPRHLLLTGLLSVACLVPVVDAVAQLIQPLPSGIVLNGITTILGDKRAIFKVSFTAGAPETEFMLPEGQARYGIQLLAVNLQSNTVTISDQGFTRIIPICPTPTLLGAAPTAAVPVQLGNGNGLEPGFLANDQTFAAETPPADPPRFAHPVNAAGWGGAQNGSQNGAANHPGNSGSPGDSSTSDPGNNNSSNTTSTDTAGADSSTDPGAGQTHEHLYQWWISDAQKIEVARKETAQRVLAGDWPAYPLTPLTPSGTLPQLVGADSVFMEHGPGIMISGN